MNKNVLFALLVAIPRPHFRSAGAHRRSLPRPWTSSTETFPFNSCRLPPTVSKVPESCWAALFSIRGTPLRAQRSRCLQRPLDRQGRPRETDDTEGRFIIESPQFLDAAVYHAGKRISLVGEVSGQEVRPLGGIHYRYPVVAAKELQLWDRTDIPAVLLWRRYRRLSSVLAAADQSVPVQHDEGTSMKKGSQTPVLCPDLPASF